MMRVPMNRVLLLPITMVVPPGWPDDQISALKPAGSLILLNGILSTGVRVGGVGIGFRLESWPLLAGLVWSMSLKPGGAWPNADPATIAKPSTPASKALRRAE